MKKRNTILIALLATTTALCGVASAQDDYAAEHDAERRGGEVSPGTEAPSRQAMVTAIERATPSALQAVLEYGERVECHECVPMLEALLLESDDALVREMAAWWLRRRNFGIGAIIQNMKETLANDADPVRRSRAAEALGEFLEPSALDPLTVAASTDALGQVRASAVRALGRLNHPGGNLVVAAALEDSESAVREAALDVILRLNFFAEHEALVGALADDSATVRQRAARLLGEMSVADAVDALAALLRGDTNRDVRQAAAWALGKIGGAAARTALSEAQGTETDSLVLDAIDVARRM